MNCLRVTQNVLIRFLLLTALAVLSQAALASPPEGTKAKTIFVKLCKVDQPIALHAVKRLGKIVSRSADNVLTVLLNSQQDADKAVISLRKSRSISEAWTANKPLLKPQVLGTVSGIKKFIADLTKSQDDDDRTVADSKPLPHLKPRLEGNSNPDYLRALLYYTERRAYPYDRIDWSANYNALDHATKMPSAANTQIKSAATRQAFATTKWAYIGPYNLDVPYQIYYGSRPTSGRLGAVAYDPKTSGTYYLGGSAGGLWKSTDSGVTWRPLGDAWLALPVSSIAIDPTNSSNVYVGTGDFHGGVGLTNGIMKSTDGGTTWTAVGTAEFGTSDVSAILIDPETPSTITVTTCYGPSGSGQVWRSTNSGQTWSSVISAQGQWTSASFSIASSTGTRTYYAASGGNSGLIYSSANRGATWTKLTSPFTTGGLTAINVVASAVDANTVYAFAADAQQVFKSTNNGGTWTNVTGNLVSNSTYNFSQSFYDYYMAVTANAGSDDLFVGLIDVAESTNAGTNWNFVGQTFTNGALSHNDQHCFAVNPKNPNEILFGNDGGIYRATRSGSTWTITGLSKTLGVTMFYHGVFDPSDPTKMIGGSQDNATPVSVGDLNNWANVGGGDGGFVAVNPSNKLVQCCTIYGLTVIQTKDGWQSQANISPNTNGDNNLPFVTPVYNDPVNTQYLYALSDYIYRFDNTSGQWTNRLGGQQLSNGSLIHALAVAPSNGSIIYTGSDDGQLFISRNGGGSFLNITGSLPNRSIQAISVDKTNPNSILVALSGSGTAHLYQCLNTSASNPVFTSVSGAGNTGLPDTSLNCIERDATAQGSRWFVGTDIGVFTTSDVGKTWANATTPLGLPIVQVTAIQETLYGTLNVATYGRGMWKIPLSAFATTSGLPPYAISIYAGSFSPATPLPVNGVITQLAKDDGVVVTAISSYNAAQQAQLAGFEADFHAGLGTLQGLGLAVTVSVSVPSTVQVYAYNLVTGHFDLVGQTPSSTALTHYTFSLNVTNPSNYMDSTGKIRTIIRSITPARLSGGSAVLRVDSFLATPVTN
jgi:hypothetical protein